MSKSGCSYGAPSETCHVVVPQCEGVDIDADGPCPNLHEWPSGKYCSKFANPAAKWQFGACNLGTHVKAKAAAATKKVNPLKASKKKMAGR